MTENMLNLIEGYIRSELIILVFVLYFIIKIFESIKMNKKYISLSVCAISVLLCGIYLFATACKYTPGSVLLSIFSAFTQGIIIAGCAIYGSSFLNSRKNGAGTDKTADTDKSETQDKDGKTDGKK